MADLEGALDSAITDLRVAAASLDIVVQQLEGPGNMTRHHSDPTPILRRHRIYAMTESEALLFDISVEQVIACAYLLTSINRKICKVSSSKEHAHG